MSQSHLPMPRRQILIGDRERDAVCQQLAEHYTAGRLLGDELEVRLEAAIHARTDHDLYQLVADLPRPAVVPSGQGAQSATTGVGATVFDIMFGFVAAAAAFFLTLLFVATTTEDGGYLMVFVLACLGSGTVAAASTHFIHRMLARARAGDGRAGSPS